ncbi:hypothetical protein BT67DRAFT_221289 [Trichocladium antarcticum]|uniref:Uncharacterized protein n=1 Tax=Trichocladium antarcticum TaxID=1450529 RepID=A0AAN6UD40_9PEZI|nr:hypothetical protein BT67DRAFT_221289 [Trichocladium antarcticum]
MRCGKQKKPGWSGREFVAWWPLFLHSKGPDSLVVTGANGSKGYIRADQESKQDQEWACGQHNGPCSTTPRPTAICLTLRWDSKRWMNRSPLYLQHHTVQHS